MLRSDVDQKRAEKALPSSALFRAISMMIFGSGRRRAKTFGAPIMIEWGTEPNGEWFAWNGKWHGRDAAGPRLFVDAYRHIVDLMRTTGAST